jgi:flavodoxin
MADHGPGWNPSLQGDISMKILVVYYSRDGHTKKAAQEIATLLQADLEEIVDQTSRRGLMGWLRGGRDAMKRRETAIGPVTRKPADYDLTVVGTPVWAWAMTPAVRIYLNRFKGQFKALACLVTSGNAKEAAIVKEMGELAGRPAGWSVGLVGRDFKKTGTWQAKVKVFVEAIRKQ